MSEKFHVILDDLTSASQTFHGEATTFFGIMSGSAAPPVADGGEAAFNRMLEVVLEEVVILHEKLADSIYIHGDKLQEARDNYAQVDQSMRELFDDLMPGD